MPVTIVTIVVLIWSVPIAKLTYVTMGMYAARRSSSKGKRFMSLVSWLTTPSSTDHPCIVCGNKQGNKIILNALHWHPEHGQLEVARCGGCGSAFTLNARKLITPYPSADMDLQDPNFIYLIYLYLELNAGLGWKIPLLERLPYHRYKSMLEIGCNVGVALDYCRTVWQIDALGLEPSAYGIKGAELLDIPIINAYTHEAEELRNRRFSFIYATEVLEHVSDPLAFLKEIRSYLEPDGVLLITTPCSSSIHKLTTPGELYAILSPGAHYFVLSQKQLRQLSKQAGFLHSVIELNGNTIIAYLSDRPITLESTSSTEIRMTAYYDAKISTEAKLDDRVYLGQLINYYISAVKSNTPFDEHGVSRKIDKIFYRLFKLSFEAPLELAERVNQQTSLFDFGMTVPYSLAIYLYHRAEYLRGIDASTGYYYELAALVAAKSLQVDFKSQFLNHYFLKQAQRQIQSMPARSRNSSQTSVQLREITDTITATIPELKNPSLNTLSKIRRRFKSLLNRWQQ
ncbi:MAG: class I SAM-dependent methyltransferase [Candidatus Thiodiazotropha sp. (ex Lucina aurantia)]|nr:class I SAM-dependent methyltransferase [Candidatus Thiodiazotropha taylori]MBT3037930.1 class I SAM-dependent methyltransferase [Candidatus Thiodiazotropha sp. (ex Codakia orbicularis)]MBV2098108.1 class I SAM-dependent methyltransferase [Candidatus Thiodiazotropha sp. (ex Codakia orbicularis)]MBV2102471.1 class I SAM-dependent methyltransferase [Candidatus Thiodiazotropha sp. (ex Lucina aurantia)]MBV2116619.1 class I SAM-dependent methyltransferase [Candidatus Thiodiazotropha sp. (ex Lucin